MTRIDSRYITEDLGLKKEIDSNGGEYYELKDEGVFIKSEDGSYWVFLPNEPINLCLTRELFELYYR